ncbi:MAG: hypothetical protein FWB95_07995 [Treponema sp.]|nr:hypothetical protein [Treponema sp.]
MNMKRLFFIIFLFIFSLGVYAQDNSIRSDVETAVKYLQYAQGFVDKEQWNDAYNAVIRASDFKDVLSDIPYLTAVLQLKAGNAGRVDAINNLNDAISVKHWEIYSENHALLFMAEQQIIIKDYQGAINSLDRISERGELANNLTTESHAQIRADAAILRLTALRAMACGYNEGYDYVLALTQFRSHVLSAMDRFPRDGRPLRIFFEYARNRMPSLNEMSEPSDLYLLELALRRLPFLLESYPDLAWMASALIWDLDEARRLTGAYRAVNYPHPSSVPIALNLGLIDDDTAIDELFASAEEGKIKIISRENAVDTYNLLRSEEGRASFTEKLNSFTGIIEFDADYDWYADTYVTYKSGSIEKFQFKNNLFNYCDYTVNFDINNSPIMCNNYISSMDIFWERYPSVKKIVSGNEEFLFGPVFLQYTPLKFTQIGGSDDMEGLIYPEFADHGVITRRALLSFCSNIIRPSAEIEGAKETIYMSRGLIQQVIEEIGGKQIAVTEFQRGLPVIQRIDLDQDGRMETIRQFRRPPSDYVWENLLDYRRLISSSQSDWRGDGRFMTKEVYTLDGSVVYYFDMDGSGELKRSETGNR